MKLKHEDATVDVNLEFDAEDVIDVIHEATSCAILVVGALTVSSVVKNILK